MVFVPSAVSAEVPAVLSQDPTSGVGGAPVSPTSIEQISSAWQKVQREGKYSGPRYRIGGPPPRKRWSMTAKQVAKLLDHPLVFGGRAKVETEAYTRYASGNESVSELAECYINSGNEFAFLVYVLDIEKNI